MDKVTKLQERIRSLKARLALEADAMAHLAFADGQAYYEGRRYFTQIREELFAAERELRALTIHTCHMPQEIATARLRAKVEAAREARVAEAITKMEQLFGGKA